MEYEDYDQQGGPDLLEWDPEDWKFPDLTLRESFDYFRCPKFLGYSSSMLDQFLEALGKENCNFAGLTKILRIVHSVVETAIKYAEDNRNAVHSLRADEEYGFSIEPTFDECLLAKYQPTQMLIASILELSDAPCKPAFVESELYAGIGLWCIGEYSFRVSEGRNPIRLFEQATLALAEASWYTGAKEAIRNAEKKISKRNRLAAIASHKGDRENKQKALLIWQSRPWKRQASAEREIVAECGITQHRAGIWIREFRSLGL